MHATLLETQSRLKNLIIQIQSVVPSDEPLGIAHGVWNLPGLTRSELIEEAQSLIDLIDERGSDGLQGSDARLKDYGRRLDFIQIHTIPQIWGSNGGPAASAYILTLRGLRKALEPVLSRDENEDNAGKMRRLLIRLRALEARLKDAEPRSEILLTMVERIEKAYQAADQLPTDMEALSEARGRIDDLLNEATKDQVHLFGIRERADLEDVALKNIGIEAAAVLQRCEHAYSSSTSVGLAAAFSERSDALSKSMWIWVSGLMTALVAGSYLGSTQLHSLSELFKAPGAAASVIVLNLILSLLSVAAPVWFSWLATKQIGQRFRLSEDYAFKASVSRAYEGYRQEAHRIDKNLEARLLESALARLDEQPLRLVESDSHGSPWHELFSSDISSNVIKRALRIVPGFADQVKNAANIAINATTITSPKLVTTARADDPS